MERDKEVARFLEEEKRKEVASRIENVLTRRIENALRDAGYDICLCNHVTFDYRNNEGTRVIVNALLEDFHVTKKEQKIIQQKDKTRSQE